MVLGVFTLIFVRFCFNLFILLLKESHPQFLFPLKSLRQLCELTTLEEGWRAQHLFTRCRCRCWGEGQPRLSGNLSWPRLKTTTPSPSPAPKLPPPHQQPLAHPEGNLALIIAPAAPLKPLHSNNSWPARKGLLKLSKCWDFG